MSRLDGWDVATLAWVAMFSTAIAVLWMTF